MKDRQIELIDFRTAEGFENLYLSCAPMISRYVASHTNDHDLGDTIAQDALLKLWQHPEILDRSKGSLKNFLYRISYNAMIDHLRSQKLRAHILNATPIDDIDTDRGFIDPNAQYNSIDDSQDTRIDLESALIHLPPTQKVAIEEVYFSDLTINQVAQNHQVPSGTIKSRLRMGLDRLRKSLSYTSDI